jgi:X-Pro dipeptidyl-peptidase
LRSGLIVTTALLTFSGLASTVVAQELPAPVDDLIPSLDPASGPENQTTAPEQAAATDAVYGYADAIRERVFVQGDFDSDADGKLDTIAMDIIRPLATETEGLQVPVIMDASPYYSTLGRGNESELKRDVNNDGILDKFPLFYDNYFVPRGYAVVLLDMVGTNNSDGCPVTGGTPDNLSAVAGIDWLNGRREGRNAAGDLVVADWHNGRTGMIGKSYDGTLANAAAATGVEGLTTIVPISAISNWYFYTRMNGIVTRANSYPSSLSNTVTNPNRRAYCAPERDAMAANDGDETGDYSPFWRERDYLPDVDNVEASVFVIHGLQDDNVRTNHFSEWWYELAERDVPRKLWLTGTGHIDPFDFRRSVWVDTLHRWFDHWLLGIDNGIMDEPMVDIEVAADTWEAHDDWPVPGTEVLRLQLREGANESSNGLLGLSAATDPATASFVDNPQQPESTMIGNPQNVTPHRRVFLSDPLEAPLRVSGTPIVKVRASVAGTDTNLGGLLVDYGSKTQISRSGDGVSTLATETCYGESTPNDDACYREVRKNTTTVTEWRVAKGILDAANRDSLTTPSPLTPNQPYNFTWDMLPNDYTFPAGHRIGVVIVGSYSGFTSTAETVPAPITLDLQSSEIRLPIAGGYDAAVASNGFLPDENPPEVTVPDDIVVEGQTSAGTVVTYEASVTDGEDPSPSVDCEPASGSTFPFGTTTVTCTGRDGSGNEDVETFTVTVTEFPFTGFFDPVKNPPRINDVKKGSSVPIKFALGGNRGLDVIAADYPRSRSINCSTGAPLGAFETATSSTGLRFDRGRYQYDWKTNVLWTGCREFVLGLVDGSEHRALFRFK